MKFMKKNGGFTLVELIVVIAILAILAAIAVPAYSGYIQKANEAGDQQLLAAVNTAFAAACLENNEDMLSLENVHIQINGEGKIAAISPNKYTKDFLNYYGDNVDSAFKVIKNCYLSLKDGVFAVSTGKVTLSSGTFSIEVNEAAKEIYGNSIYKDMESSVVLGQIDTVAGAAAGLIGPDGHPTLTSIVTSEEYMNDLAVSMGMKDATELGEWMTAEGVNTQEFLANSLVLSVADKAATIDTNALFTSGDMTAAIRESLASEDPAMGLAQTALVYGMYSAYAQTNGKPVPAVESVDDIFAMIDEMEATDESGKNLFQEYLNSDNGQADLNGYLAAMDVVNSSANNADNLETLLTGGFANDDLAALLDQLAGE